MADSADTLPVMTDEQRRKNLKKAAAVRRERKALLDLVREGSVTFGQASADPRYWRIPVVRLLVAVPGVGKAKAAQLMTEAGVSPSPDNRRYARRGGPCLNSIASRTPFLPSPTNRWFSTRHRVRRGGRTE